MPAFKIWASNTTSSSRDGVRGSPFRGCDAPLRAVGTNFACCALAPNVATARRAQAHRARRGRTMTTPPKFERHGWCLHGRGQRPQSRTNLLGAVGKCPSPHACRFVGGWHPTPSPPICGCKPVPRTARAFHGRSVETAETLQNPCCSRARIAEKPGGGEARRRPCLVPHRLFDPAGCISVLRTRLRRSIDSPLPSPTGVRVPHAPAGAVRPLTKRRGSLWEQRGRSARARPAVRAPQKSR